MERFGEQGLAIVGGLLAPRDLARARVSVTATAERKLP